MAVTLTDPNLGYLLLLLGLWGVVFSIYKPGTGLFEPLAVLALIGAAFVLAALPTNIVAAALVGIGVLLFTLAPALPRFPWPFAVGALGLQALGSIFLYNLGVAVSPLMLGAGLVATSGIFLLILLPLMRKQRSSPVVSDDESIIGSGGYVTKALEPHGTVNIRGELWSASAAGGGALAAGERVKVVDKEGLRLIVTQDKRKRTPDARQGVDLEELSRLDPPRNAQSADR
jgi:membrane-bound serine protease (ClpP class)